MTFVGAPAELLTVSPERFMHLIRRAHDARKEDGMSDDKLRASLVALEKARVDALEAAIAEHQYRMCAILDPSGSVQRGINRAQRMLPTVATKSSKK